jgi:mono/diheme cytochrome c family protein
MAATDKTYRNQRVLDIVFGVSCVLMLLSVVWMFVQDYNREFKAVQRDFRRVEESLNEFQMIRALPEPDVVRAKHKAVDDARARLDKVKSDLASTERELIARRDIADMEYRTIKADFDAQTSYYNIEVEHLGKADSEVRRTELQNRVQEKRKVVDDLGNKLAAAQKKLDAINQEIKEKVTSKLEEPQQELAQAEDDLKKTSAVFDRFAKATAQKSWGLGYELRAMPILDAFESPVKIKQVWLPDLTIDYGGFKDVPRYDRCVSCHLGIDRATFSSEALLSLTRPPDKIQEDIKKNEAKQKELLDKEQTPELEQTLALLKRRGEKLQKELEEANSYEPRLKLAHEILQERAKTENLGFNPKYVPDKVRWLDLKPGQVKEYAAHPRLDLFVDGNSAHPMEKFGCTSCHAGQGSATDFLNAVHTPADAEQEAHWKKDYDWKSTHFWDFPMLSSRFIESSCLKCHHQVTDLVRNGSKEEAPKLLRGYQLVQENGCFGCHEISGIKSGRAVGPDLRLEPTPALEYLTHSEQDRARADPLNPPGTYRKVGPSLRRIAEKTNQDWARKWIQSPRGFRPDTKMPHFYGLSNNSSEEHSGLIKDDLLPDEQKPFPAAEIAAIAHYLFTESKGQLDGSDFTHKVLEQELRRLHNNLKTGRLSVRDQKDLTDKTRRLGDLALLSSASRSGQVNNILGQLRTLQDRLQQLQQKAADVAAAAQVKGEEGSLSDEEKKELEQGGKDLDQLAEQLVKAGRPRALSEELVDGEGTPVKLSDGDDKDLGKRQAHGRQLFTERGCLACHSHEGTTKEGGGVPAVHGEANFGPNLSRIAAKIAPEVGGKPAARRWLVQWIMNPTVYHLRTRMPVTHLNEKDAGDVADWLLSQKVTDWDQKGPAEPALKDLVTLARVYLIKAPGMTPQDVDDYLPVEAAERPGVLKERMDTMPPDADERVLAGPLKDDDESKGKLKWYIGRKAVSRLGCFGCHDVPGFETAKPIGTALNDWGKKDPERMAFEDADVFVSRHYNTRVEVRNDRDNPAQPAKEWQVKDGKKPYEEVYDKALEHHRREGFLHLKLEEPRSFDYHRIRTWDDRLRMPQFRFARTVRRQGESDEDFLARQTFEEAEAREAVMTFILGLVAEPVPLKYVNAPRGDRLAEVKGRQVLDKFNCAGCHQIAPGSYDIRRSDEQTRFLEAAYQDTDARKKPGDQKDHVFHGHNAWTGTTPASPDRMSVLATHPRLDTEFTDPDQQDRSLSVLSVRLASALRFTGRDRVVRDLPAGSLIPLLPDEVLSRADPHGGTFTDLMVKYLAKVSPERFKLTNGDNDTARAKLPPPLFREGERVQPGWLYGFLRNPTVVRPEGYMLLRMPKFNMSAEDAQALVNYFSAAARLNNPGAGVSAEYLTVQQRDEQYWQRQTADYVARLKKEGKTFDEHRDAMKPFWEESLKTRVAEGEVALSAAEDEVKKAKGDDKTRKEQEVSALKSSLDGWKKALKDKDYGRLQTQWERKGAYATDAYRLLTDRNLCLQCHNVGSVRSADPQGPNLALTAERLRPEWVEQWIANPARLFTYPPAMPQNFPKNPVDYQNVFKGSSREQATAVRDVLMDLPRLGDMPGIRPRGPARQEEVK